MECYDETMYCPKSSSCTIVCSGMLSCTYLTIQWSDELVESSLICNATDNEKNACDGVNRPPQEYSRYFDGDYTFTHLQSLSQDLKITQSYTVSFDIIINDLSQSSGSILSITDDANITLLNLSLIYNEDADFLQLFYENDNDAHIPFGFLSNDNSSIHSVEMKFNKFSRNRFKVDGKTHIDIAANSAHLFNYSSFQNKVNFSMYVGSAAENNPLIDGEISNIGIHIDIDSYFRNNIEDVASICFTKVFEFGDRLWFEPEWTYYNNRMFVFDLWNPQIINISSPLENSFYEIEFTQSVNTPFSQMSRTVTKRINNLWFVLDKNLFGLKLYSVDLISYDIDTLLELNSSINYFCGNDSNLFFIYTYHIVKYEISTAIITTDEFTEPFPMSPSSQIRSCEVYDQSIYIFGGYRPGGWRTIYAHAIHEYNLVTNSIKLLNVKLTQPVSTVSSFQWNEYIYLIAGNLNISADESSISFKEFTVQIFDASNHFLFVSPDSVFLEFASGSVVDKRSKYMMDFFAMYQYDDYAALIDFEGTLNQIVDPGGPFYLNFSVSGCSLMAEESMELLLKSQIAEIGINHRVVIRKGECSEIIDLNGVSSPCSKGITPIIPLRVSDLKSFAVDIIGSDQHTLSPASSFDVFVRECSVGSGYDDDAIIIDCKQCQVNTFKITEGNAPCYECSDQDGFSCDGKDLITINYNLWFAAFDETSKDYISPFEASSNSALYAIQCPVKFQYVS